MEGQSWRHELQIEHGVHCQEAEKSEHLCSAHCLLPIQSTVPAYIFPTEASAPSNYCYSTQDSTMEIHHEKFSLHSSLTQGNIFLTRCYTLYIIYDTILNRAVQYNLSLLIWITLKTYYFTWSLGKSGAEAEISRQEDDWDMFFEITQR